MRRRAPRWPASRRCSTTWWPAAAGAPSGPPAWATTSGPAGPGRTPFMSWPRDRLAERTRRRANPPGRAVRRVAVRGGRRHVGARRVAFRGSDDEAAAYAAYRTALDREAQAARTLELRLAGA